MSKCWTPIPTPLEMPSWTPPTGCGALETARLTTVWATWPRESPQAPVASSAYKKAIAATQRRKGAKTQGFRVLSSLTRWVGASGPGFHSHFPALCVLASWRLCVECLSWVHAVSCQVCRGVWVRNAGSQCIKDPGTGCGSLQGYYCSRVVGPSRFGVSRCQTGKVWLTQ